MASKTADFRDLLNRISSGDNEALQALMDGYRTEVLRVIRRHIRRDLRKRFDSEDFAQAVWLSLYNKRCEITKIDSPETLGRYLAQMAKHKVIDEGRRQTGAKRNIRRDVNINGSRLAVDDLEAGHSPTPSQLALSKEQLSLLINLARDDEKKMVQWRLEGLTFADIADRIGMDERTIRRRFQRLQRKVTDR